MMIYQSIHQQAIRAARTYQKSQHELLVAIQQVDSKRVYLKFGYKNLYDYCIKCLRLSEGTTYAIIRVARKSIDIPEIQRAIEQGTLSLSHAKTILAVIKPENANEWLEKAKNFSVRQLEKEVAQESQETLIRERLRHVSGNQVKLECGIDQKTSRMIQRAQDVLSQKTGRSITLRDAVELVFSDFLKRNDPVDERRREPKPLQDPKKFSASIKRARLWKDQGRCQRRIRKAKSVDNKDGSTSTIYVRFHKAEATLWPISLRSAEITIGYGMKPRILIAQGERMLT